MLPAHKNLQRAAQQRMWRDIERKRRRERLVAGPLGWIMEGRGVLTSAPFVIALIVCLSLVWVVRVLAVEIPQPCIELAESLGLPLPSTLSRFWFTQAKAELKFMSNADPAVKRCREALAKMEGRK